MQQMLLSALGFQYVVESAMQGGQRVSESTRGSNMVWGMPGGIVFHRVSDVKSGLNSRLLGELRHQVFSIG